MKTKRFCLYAAFIVKNKGLLVRNKHKRGSHLVSSQFSTILYCLNDEHGGSCSREESISHLKSFYTTHHTYQDVSPLCTLSWRVQQRLWSLSESKICSWDFLIMRILSIMSVIEYIKVDILSTTFTTFNIFIIKFSKHVGRPTTFT